MPITHREVRRHPLWAAAFAGSSESRLRHDGRSWHLLLALGLVLLCGALAVLALIG